MALILDEAVKLFVAQRLRPRAEAIRDLLTLLQDDHLEYWQTINGLITAPGVDGADVVDDPNRLIKPITKDNLILMKAREDGLLAVLEAANAMDVVSLFPVRPPNID